VLHPLDVVDDLPLKVVRAQMPVARQPQAVIQKACRRQMKPPVVFVTNRIASSGDASFWRHWPTPRPTAYPSTSRNTGRPSKTPPGVLGGGKWQGSQSARSSSFNGSRNRCKHSADADLQRKKLCIMCAAKAQNRYNLGIHPRGLPVFPRQTKTPRIVEIQGVVHF
jgi:hypothetical protein